MMRLLRWSAALVGILLVLELLKIGIKVFRPNWALFGGLFLASLQYLLLLLFFFVLICYYVAGHKIAWRPFLVKTVLSFFVILFALESLCSFLLSHPGKIPTFLLGSFKYYYEQYDRRIVQYESEFSRYDKNLFYTLRPRKQFKFVNREFNNDFEVNSKGLRDSEAALLHPEIIFVGDSYMLGWGVNQKESIPAQVGSISGKSVLNAAMSSYGTVRELLRLRDLDTSALRYLVIQYCGNDFEENESYRIHQNQLPISSLDTYDSTTSQYEWSRKYFPGKISLTVGSLILKKQINRIYPLFRLYDSPPGTQGETEARGFLNVLEHEISSFHHLTILIFVADAYGSDYSHFLNAIKRNLSLPAHRVLVVDVSKVIGPSDYFTLDPHFNSSGCKKIAKQLAEVIHDN